MIIGEVKECLSKTGELHLNDKLIRITSFNTNLNTLLGTDFQAFTVYRSKGLMTHMINKKHFTAAKYIDYLPEIIESPDYAGYYNGNIELVKVFKDNIFISIKLDKRSINIMSQPCSMQRRVKSNRM